MEKNRSKVILGLLKKATDNRSLAPEIKNEIECSKELRYHLDMQIPISSNVFRIYSSSFYNIFNESRNLWKTGSLKVSKNDEFFLNTDIGKFAELKGTMVPLDLPIPIDMYYEEIIEKSASKDKKRTPKLNSPRRIGKNDPGYKRKKFIVHVKDPSTGRIKTITFGDPNLSIRANSPERRKSFLARHNCDSPGPRTKARWWSCNLHRYKKQLGLSFEGRW
jgi:hypothetical protein